MNKKHCPKCNNKKPISDFYKDSHSKGGLAWQCKDCAKDQKKVFYKNNKENIKMKNRIYHDKNRNIINKKTRDKRKEKPWKFTLYDIKKRCENSNCKRYKDYGGRGIKCKITEGELEFLWYRDEAYNLKQPTIDRIDNNGNYELSNCQYIELSENSVKDKRKPIFQYELNGKFIEEFQSITIASYKTNIDAGDIGQNAKKKSKTCGGFVWEYKNKEKENV